MTRTNELRAALAAAEEALTLARDAEVLALETLHAAAREHRTASAKTEAASERVRDLRGALRLAEDAER